MTIEKDFSHIAKAIAKANANGNAVPTQFKGLVQELREEQLAENVVVEHGLLEATSHDINEEVDGWKPSEEVDFDADENLVDMDSVSVTMREVFES